MAKHPNYFFRGTVMKRPRKLLLEVLEDRTAPATFGIPWPDAARLSLSFVPDGTPVAGQQSRLFALMNATAPTQTWEQVILRAFQSWAAPTNINLTVAADSGALLGTTGPIQHDSRFGDIRIAAVPMASNVIAFALPFDFSAGSWAGDLEFNSNYLFNIGGSSGYDLFTIALHEAGHALSLASSSDPTSAMYDTYQGVRTGISSGDEANIEALYGVRAMDSFDAAAANNSLSTATALNLSSGGNGQSPTVVDANLNTLADLDYYNFKPGNNQTTLSIMIQTSGISLVMPTLTVYSPSQAVITSLSTPDPVHGDLSAHLSNLIVGATYYVEVSSGTGDSFSVGTYRMQIVPEGVAPASGAPSTTPVLPANDGHTNDTFGTATDIRTTIYQTSTAYAYALQAGISDGTDLDYYHLRSPQGPNGSTVVMTALVWGTDVGGLDPVLSIFDSHNNLINANVLVNENNSEVVQVPSALPNTDYWFMVRAEEPNGPNSTGNYFLGAEFNSAAVNLQKLSSGTVNQAASQTLGTLQVAESQLYHWELSASSAQASAATGLVMTIYDQFGNVVSSLTVMNGQTKSLTVFLAPGNYTVQISGITTDGSPFAPLSYSLFGLGLSDPIGPTTTNPTSTPPSGGGSNWVAHA
jgi:hypothetical protein